MGARKSVTVSGELLTVTGVTVSGEACTINPISQLSQSSLIDLSIVYPRCRLCSCLLWRAIEFEDALHWLSTLGGAFSNLGEGSYNFVSAVDKVELFMYRVPHPTVREISSCFVLGVPCLGSS